MQQISSNLYRRFCLDYLLLFVIIAIYFPINLKDVLSRAVNCNLANLLRTIFVGK